jgi:NHL repeat
MLAACSSNNGVSSSFAPAAPSLGATAQTPVRDGVQPENLLARNLPSNVIPGPNTGASFMSPEVAKAKQNLYISDYFAKAVYVYAWPKPEKRIGQLTGFKNPEGLCADAAGNIFVTDAGDGRIVEFKAGSTKPTRTLTDPNGDPGGCSVDPKTGDLAVSNLDGAGSNNGGIVVYTKAKGTPQMYGNASLVRVFCVGYDNQGTLWIGGQNARTDPSFVYASMSPAGTFKVATLTGADIVNPDQVQWDGKQMAVGGSTAGSGNSAVFQTKAFNVSGTTTFASPKPNEFAQYWIDGGKTLIAPDAYNQDVEIYKYPEGGNPTQTITGDFKLPIGATVSSK